MITNITILIIILIIIIDDKFHHLRRPIMLIYSQIFNETSFRDYERFLNDISKQWISLERESKRVEFLLFLCRVNLAV